MSPSALRPQATPPPTLYTASEIKANPTLSASITDLVNSAFQRSKHPLSDGATDSKWDMSRPRFPSPDALHDMLCDERSVMAVIYEADSSLDSASTPPGHEEAKSTPENRKVIACAAAVPWAGGWRKEGAGSERGWEIKTICVDGDARYLRKGLAVCLLGFLEVHLVSWEKEALGKRGQQQQQGRGQVVLWILAAECINGAYWRKKGFREVRRAREGPGVWGCKGEFDMVVFNKTVEL